MSARPCNEAGRRARNPELLALAGVDVVLAHEREPAVSGDAIDHDAGGQRLERVAVAHRERPDARRHEQLPARVDAEGSQMDAAAFDGLDEARLPGLRIDGEHGNVVLAAVEDLLAFELDLALVAVGEIDEAAVRVHVNWPRALRRFDVGGIGQGILDEDRVAAEAAVRLQLVGVELVLPLDRNVDPGLRGMEIEMPRPEAKPGSRRDRSQIRQRTAFESEELERAGILRLATSRVVAARNQDRGLVSGRRADLMPIDAGIELVRLAYRFADGAVAVDAMDGDVARVVVGGKQIFARPVDAGVNRTRR